MSKGSLSSKAVSLLMSVVLALGLMPLPAYAGSGELATASVPIASEPVATGAEWEAYGVYGGQYVYLVDLSTQQRSEDTWYNEYDAKVVRADGEVVMDLPIGGAYKEVFPQADTMGGAFGLGSDLEGGYISLRESATGLRGVKRLDGSIAVPFKYDYVTPYGKGLAQFVCSWHDSSNAGIDYLDGNGEKVFSVSRAYSGQHVTYTYLQYGSEANSYPYDMLGVECEDGGNYEYDHIVVEKSGSSYIERTDLDRAPEWQNDYLDDPDYDMYADGWWNQYGHVLDDGTVVSYAHEVVYDESFVYKYGGGAGEGYAYGKVSVVGQDGLPVTLGGYTLGVRNYPPTRGPGLVEYTAVANALHNLTKHGNADVWWATDEDGDWGAVDSNGEVVVPFEYEAYADRGLDGTDYALVKQDGAWSFLDLANGSDAPKVDISGADVSVSKPSYLYAGSPVEPEVTVALGGEALPAGSYDVAYSGNDAPGAATVTVTGKGAYEGEASCTFKLYRVEEDASSSALATADTSAVDVALEGDEVGVKLEVAALAPGSQSELARAARAAGTADADFKVFDVALRTVRADGSEARTLTGEGALAFGAISVSFNLGAAYRGYLATVRQLHGGGTIGNGAYTVPASGVLTVSGVDRLSEFAISLQEQRPASTTPAVAKVAMHRLYNPYSGEHFYTAGDGERDQLKALGWNDEGEGWTAPATSATPVFRLYNAYAGDHHYTTSASERDALKAAGWSYEGVGWYSDDAKAVPLYRQYNPYATTGSHNYTTSQAENDQLVKLGWRAEGVGWYGVS